MLVLQRIVLPAVNALLITAALIYGMFLLIESAPLELSEHKSYKLDWVQVPEEVEDVIVLAPTPTKPEPVKEQPIIERFNFKHEALVSSGVHIPMEPVTLDPGEIGVYKSDQLTLTFAYPAVYPASKLNRGIEGFVTVGFSVSPVGAVYDAYVIESEPKGAFDKAALKAIAQFKYKPRYENERAVSTEGQRYIFRFEINE